MAEHMQIGEVADLTELSLRTIRYYEEVGLVLPSARSKGGFRLYTADDAARLTRVRRMKPLDFTVEEMKELLHTLDELRGDGHPSLSRDVLIDRVAMYRDAALARVRALRHDMETALSFAADLQTHLVGRAGPRVEQRASLRSHARPPLPES